MNLRRALDQIDIQDLKQLLRPSYEVVTQAPSLSNNSDREKDDGGQQIEGQTENSQRDNERARWRENREKELSFSIETYMGSRSPPSRRPDGDKSGEVGPRNLSKMVVTKNRKMRMAVATNPNDTVEVGV
ncbi:hypothetical protein ACFX15_009577 [Malus domestica]